MTAGELREAIDTYNQLLRTHQLNIELLETLELTLFSVKDFCVTHGIPFGNSKIDACLSKVVALLDEIGQLATDDFSHEPKNRRRLHRTKTHKRE